METIEAAALHNKVGGANMGPIWDRQDPGGPHVDPMNLIIWETAPFRVLSVLCDRSASFHIIVKGFSHDDGTTQIV